MEYNRRINKAGNINIPAALRRELGIQGGERVVIDVDNRNGSLNILRVEGSCILCGANENLKTYEGKFVCQVCISNIKNL